MERDEDEDGGGGVFVVLLIQLIIYYLREIIHAHFIQFGSVKKLTSAGCEDVIDQASTAISIHTYHERVRFRGRTGAR